MFDGGSTVLTSGAQQLQRPPDATFAAAREAQAGCHRCCQGAKCHEIEAGRGLQARNQSMPAQAMAQVLPTPRAAQ